MSYREPLEAVRQRQDWSYRSGYRLGLATGFVAMGTLVLAAIGFAVLMGWV